jgi:Dodecin
MAQKVIEIVGSSKESFAKAAENAVHEAAKTVRGMKWARATAIALVFRSFGVPLIKCRRLTNRNLSLNSSRKVILACLLC